MLRSPSVADTCPACGNSGMRLLSAPRPQYVEQCSSCRSTFFHFGAAGAVSHNDQYNVDADYQRYLESINETSHSQRYEQTLARLRAMTSEVEHPSVFDIGAGGGDFLATARNRGFRIAGNEVSQPAIDACRERHGIELISGDDLAALARDSAGFDAVTMWCVIAHVDEPEELLRCARGLLRPGGVLFFCTPRYCAIDRGALMLRRLTSDRYRRVFDRRINDLHRRQYSRNGMASLLRREGFLPVAVEPAIGYGLHMEAYLQSIGFPAAISKPFGGALEASAKAGLLPRNILNVYARAV
jgi:SAM-dependent methyltransferase